MKQSLLVSGQLAAIVTHPQLHPQPLWSDLLTACAQICNAPTAETAAPRLQELAARTASTGKDGRFSGELVIDGKTLSAQPANVLLCVVTHVLAESTDANSEHTIEWTVCCLQ